MSPTPKLTPPLRALGLRKRYGQTTVVEDVGLSVRPGEVLGLLGPNGAGKTTTFYMLVGLVRPDGGEIRLGEAVITREPIHARAKRGIAYLPQEASVFRGLSVEDNLLAILELRDDLTRQARRQRCDALLEEFSLSDRRRRRVHRGARNEDPSPRLGRSPCAAAPPRRAGCPGAAVDRLGKTPPAAHRSVGGAPGG